MFYAHFVLSKKGPLARIWLAAHWDKKLTKAHVFETNIDSSVEAIIQPKVKMALRTSGHLLLGVVRIYSRKAKYLLADCNEAFVKIKMAFRPGVVDLPEENREAAVATITLPETFHDFDTTMADLTDIDVQAQFSVNQSRPEEITMREEMGNITLVGDEGFGPGDLGFDEKTIIQDVHMDNTLYKTPSHTANITFENPDPIKEPQGEKNMDIDLPKDDGFGDALPDFDDDGPAGCDDDDVSDHDDNDFGGDMDPNLFDDDFGAGLFEEHPEVPVVVPDPAPQAPVQKEVEDMADNTAHSTVLPEQTTLHTDQTTLVPNESEAFALEPLDVTSMGTERKAKRKRKLIVDEQKGIASETMKMQLSDTSEIVTTLDLAPPTKKLMHWKETGGVEKLFALPGRSIVSRRMNKMFNGNLITRPMAHDIEDTDLQEEVPLELTDHETLRDDNQTLREEEAQLQPPPQETPSIVEDPSKSHIEPPLEEPPSITEPSRPSIVDSSLVSQAPDTSLAAPQPEVSLPVPEISDLEATRQQDLDEEDDIFNDMLPDEPLAQEAEQVDHEYEEKRWSKRTQQLLHILDRSLQFGGGASFKETISRNNRKQVASKFYTLLVLKKQQAILVQQDEPYGDIIVNKGPMYETVMG